MKAALLGEVNEFCWLVDTRDWAIWPIRRTCKSGANVQVAIHPFFDALDVSNIKMQPQAIVIVNHDPAGTPGSEHAPELVQDTRRVLGVVHNTARMDVINGSIRQGEAIVRFVNMYKFRRDA